MHSYGRPVRVAGYHHAYPRGWRIHVQLVQIVQNAHCYAVDFLDPHLGQIGKPIAVIHISANGYHRRDALQDREHFRAADVAGVQNHPAAGQGRQGLRPYKAVRVGNNADRLHHEFGHVCVWLVATDNIIQEGILPWGVTIIPRRLV